MPEFTRQTAWRGGNCREESLARTQVNPPGAIMQMDFMIPQVAPRCMIVTVIDPVHHGPSPKKYFPLGRDTGSIARKIIRLVSANCYKGKGEPNWILRLEHTTQYNLRECFDKYIKIETREITNMYKMSIHTMQYNFLYQS
ncbi:Sulfotransferase [Psidium guajava]|nr:Sulfotransferase [Psidium guajava]